MEHSGFESDADPERAIISNAEQANPSCSDLNSLEGENPGEMVQPSASSVKTKIDQLSDTEIVSYLESELALNNKLWTPLMVEQIKTICEALNIIDRCNSSLASAEIILEAKEYIDDNIRRVRQLRQNFGSIVPASPYELGSRVFRELSVLGKQSSRFFNSMRSDDLSKASETLQPLKAWHKISIKRKKQILVFSYVVRENVNNFTDLDFAYAEDELCKIKGEIEKF